MKLKMYSIFDSAAAAYMRPFFVQTDSVALRAFQDLAINAEHEVGRHPEHYSLFRIGEFDDNEIGKSYFEGVECIAQAHELVAKAQVIEPGSLRSNGESDATFGDGA